MLPVSSHTRPYGAPGRAASAKEVGLPPAKLSRKSNWVARGWIRQFESDMPSQAVRLRRVDRVGAVAPAQPKSGLRQRAKAGRTRRSWHAGRLSRHGGRERGAVRGRDVWTCRATHLHALRRRPRTLIGDASICSRFVFLQRSQPSGPKLEELCVPKTPSVLIRAESPTLSGDDRSVLPLPGPLRLAVQVEEPT